MALRTCTVSCRDCEGREHCVEVTAETLYEAIARALVAFKADGWVGNVGREQILTVKVPQPAVEHRVRIADFENWLKSHGRSPAEATQKARLRSILGS